MLFNLKNPPLLKKGDTVAAVSTSWGGAAVFPHRYETGKKQFEETFGLKVVTMPHALCSPQELDLNPKARADDINEAVKNPDIKAIISIIGGEDSIRLLPYLDYEAIAKNPKFFMGYSDPTAICFAFLKAGVAPIYGPAFLTTFAENGGIFPYVKNSFQKVLMTGDFREEIKPSLKWTAEMLPWEKPENRKKKRRLIENQGYRFLQGEKTVQGPLIGGCLEVLEMIKATQVWPDLTVWDGCVLFLDLSEEKPTPTYIVRCLRNYMASGILQRIKGILVGRPYTENEREACETDEAFIRAVSVEAGLTDMPVVTRMDFGHTDPMLCLPYGATVRICPDKKTVCFV